MTNQHIPTVTFHYVSDPSHSWLIVSPQWIGAVGLNLARFSQCSYVHLDGTLALEEDCDAPVFLNAYKRCFGETLDIIEIHIDDVNAQDHVRSWYPLHAVAAAA